MRTFVSSQVSLRSNGASLLGTNSPNGITLLPHKAEAGTKHLRKIYLENVEIAICRTAQAEPKNPWVALAFGNALPNVTVP